MIYLFSGDDAKNKIAQYEKVLKSLSKDAEVFSVNRNDFDQNQVESLCSGSGLFFAKAVAVFSDIFENEKNRDFILGKLEPMRMSDNDFVFLEGKLSKSVLEVFKKAKAEIRIFDLTKEKKEKFDNFLLADAFARKDKFSLWLYFRQAVETGASLEALAGILFWKIKDLILKKNFSKFSEMELKSFATRLSCLLPAARKEGCDAEAAFEQFLLGIL
ncbi:MAG: hypothetical protein WAN61_03120 [Minisyncoccia bacterium]